jgi:SagB-type dehydrogenase family enzyme
MRYRSGKPKIFFFISFFIFTSTVMIPANLFAQSLETIRLLPANLERGISLMKALKERKSTRAFRPQELPLEVLSNLLWAANGINRPESGLRTAPTATNAQEIDIYVAMKKGLYRYNASQNLLEPVLSQDIRESCGFQEFTQEAPVDLIYVANFKKLRAEPEFYSATDTGFISQNVYLFCASEGLATVVLGWIDKPKLAQIMGLSADQVIVLTQPVGYPK